MDYTLAIYDQPADGRAVDPGHGREARQARLPRGHRDAPLSTRLRRARPAHRQALRPRPEDGPLQARPQRLPRLPRALEGGAAHASTSAKKIRPATPRYHWIDTLYALSEATLYAALVEALEKTRVRVDYARLFTDIRESIDEAHRDGTILDAVDARPRRASSTAIPISAATLHKLRSAGKRLFLLTNSRWAYTDKMMNYLLGGAMAEYPTLAELLRRDHRRRHEARVLPGAPAADRARRREGAHAAAFPLERGARLRRRQPPRSSSAPRRHAATRSSTSAITSTATSSARRRRARGARP